MPATAVLDAPTADVDADLPQGGRVLQACAQLREGTRHEPGVLRLDHRPRDPGARRGPAELAFKELVILKTLRATGASCSYGAHERLAVEPGNSPDRIGDLNNSLWQDSPHFSEAERAVFALIEQIDEDADDVGDQIWVPLL